MAVPTTTATVERHTMSIRIEVRKESSGELSVVIECDDRIPSEEIIPWTETFRQLAEKMLSGFKVATQGFTPTDTGGPV